MKKLGLSIIILLALTVITFGQSAEELKRASGLYSQGLQYYQNVQYDKTIEAFTEYLKIRPNIAEAFYNRGLAYYMKGLDFSKNTEETSKANLRSAAANFSQAIKFKPDSVDYWISRGRSYYWLKNDGVKFIDLAISDFTQEIKLNPNSAMAYYERGKAYREGNQLEKALTDFNKAIQLNPNHADSYFERGKVYFLKYNFTLAKDDFSKAYQISPFHQYAKTWLDSANQKLNPPKDSVNTTQTSTSTKLPQNSPAANWEKSLTEGNNFLERKEADKAIVAFQNAYNLYPPISEDKILELITASQKAQIQESIAKAYILKKDYKNAATNCLNAQQFIYKKIVDRFAKIAKQPNVQGELMEITKSKLDLKLIDWDLLIAQSTGAIDLSKRCLNYFPMSGLTADDQLMAIGVGTMKILIAEFVSIRLLTNSSIRLSLSEICAGKGTNICGVNSRSNQISEYANKSLADINKAIEYSPALKKLYTQRAAIYRNFGKNDLALADEAKASQLK